VVALHAREGLARVPQLDFHLATARSRARIAAATLFDHLRGDFTHDRSTNATGLLLAE